MADELKADRYKIEKELGRGGMGVVLRARDTRLGRMVALKMLPGSMTQNAELRRRLAVEARAASSLSHPGVATVYDFFEQADESFIVYEYVEGCTLREKLRKTRCTTEEVLEIGIQLADALAAAHDRGIVHRDLKPENIMVLPGPQTPGRAKILDFGLAKRRPPLASAAEPETVAETAPVSTAPGLLVGTVNYMAPEQLEGEAVDARTDLYALGLVLYEMATGTNPFLGKSPTSTIANILKHEPPPMGERNPLAPAELDRIVRKCLRKRREERYQSARELWVDLSNLRHDSGERGRVAPPEAEAAEPGILSGLHALWGASPRRWWELNLLSVLLIFNPLFVYLGWEVKGLTLSKWGLILFFAELAFVAAQTVLRLILLMTGAFNPRGLPGEVRRLAPWVRSATAGMVVVILGMAALVAASHTGLGALLIGLGVGGMLGCLIYEPSIDRAAFPSLYVRDEAKVVPTPAPGAESALGAGAIGAGEAPLMISRGLVRALILLIEAGYLTMYGVFFVYFPEVMNLQANFAHPLNVALAAMVAALCGTPVRLYILSATALDYLDLGRKFRRLFPAVLLIDVCWAALPLLLTRKLGGIIILCSAGLAYLPFAQRTLVFSAYSSKGGRTSGIHTPSSV
jgi:predicted Ser/Thr protein kinase